MVYKTLGAVLGGQPKLSLNPKILLINNVWYDSLITKNPFQFQVFRTCLFFRITQPPQPPSGCQLLNQFHHLLLCWQEISSRIKTHAKAILQLCLSMSL